MIRYYGVEGLQFHVRRHVDLAQQFLTWVKQDGRFEIAAPAPLNLVCFRHRGGDEANETLMSRLNSSGELILTHTKLGGKFTAHVRGTDPYQERHVKLRGKRIQEEAAKLNEC